MKTPHRLIHDAKEAGVITELEWKAFIESWDACDKSFIEHYRKFSAETASEALQVSFRWGHLDSPIWDYEHAYWTKVSKRLKARELINEIS